ncbi:polysaccharide lyase family 8 super-sandwich domain-containing protein [Paenibacillus sp. V4I5]|uniref:polysaccharide lyase family 8 super-sandwich domain-containing protein n=1 Tax=Paenibacillus sp. V4I5 TaxID=3042306 RepID=UPI0027919439|nr:polysaccharide lyase family 8 super-sandwich domain-containing protein [Paenibacillus sp. V4I5]MDQ0914569.1 hyaluronate lyase [Paenibacillus sp. V4I5]
MKLQSSTLLKAVLSCLLFVSLLVTSVVPVGKAYADDEYDGLREKWRSYLLGGAYSESDPDVITKLNEQSTLVQSTWDSMEKSSSRTYLWSDLNDTSVDNLTKSSYMSITYSRLYTLALGYARHGSAYYQNAALLSDIISGLDWMYTNKYNASASIVGNWFDWEVNVPLTLNNMTVVLYTELTTAQKTNYMAAINQFAPDATITNGSTATGANRVWKATAVGIRGMIVKDSAKLASSRDALTDVFIYVTSGDGFYADGSFIQHTAHPYTGGYGKSLLETIVPFIYLLNGSTWAVVTPAAQNLYNWIYDSFEPLIYKGAMMDMSRGREISRRASQDHALGAKVMAPILQMTQFAPAADAARLKSMVKYWLQEDTYYNFNTNATLYHLGLAKQILNDTSIISRGELIKYNQYPSMDRAVQLRPGFGFALSMSSSRIYNYESINLENLKGWYTGEGMTYLYNNDLGQYSDEYWALVDKYRLPGTTVDVRTRADSSGSNYKSANNWVGGTSAANQYGVSGMELDAWSSTLTAKKSWFMFDNEVVALGSGITSTDNRAIETIMENRKINDAGDNALTVNGSAKSSALGWSEMMTGVNWMHLAGQSAGSDIGYFFPGGTTIKGLREARTGGWDSVNTYAKTLDTTVLTKNFLTLWQDHGANPTNGQYAYAILPNQSSAQVASYAANPDFTILANTADVQAVQETTIGAVGANFWSDAVTTVSVDGAPYLTSNKKASVMAVENGGEIELGVSDPTQANTGTIELELHKSAAAVVTADSGVTVVQLSPTIKLSVQVNGQKGKSLHAKLILGIAPSSDAFVRNGTYVANNYGSSVQLEVKNDIASYAREGFVQFDLSAFSGSVASAKVKLTPVNVGMAGITNEAAVVSDSSWTETLLTWNNKPASSAVIGTWTPVLNIPIELDVTSQVQGALSGDKKLSLRIYAPTNQGTQGFAFYGSKEQTDPAKRPVLVIVQPISVAAAADSYVRNGTYAGVNYSTATGLVTKNSTSGFTRESYVKFDVSAITGTISSAKVRLVPTGVGSSLTTNQAELVSDNSWGESTLTWNNKPASGTMLGTWSGMVVGVPVEIDVTSQVQTALAGDHLISLRISSPTDVGSAGDITYGSREKSDASVRPVLIIQP